MNPQTAAEQLFFVAVRIDTTTADGRQGSGTGFYFGHTVDGRDYSFIVTNKHVVRGMREGHLTFLQQHEQRPLLGKGFRLRIDDWDAAWFGHPEPEVDIAICPLDALVQNVRSQYGLELYTSRVMSNLIPTPAEAQTIDAIEPVSFVGYPNGVWDSKNLLPIVRQGTTASPMEVDFDGTPCFLIDASVFGGSSGSPVFVFNQGSYAYKGGGTVVGSRLHFVGVIARVFYRTDHNRIVAVPIPTHTQPMAEQTQMIDLGVVFKARTVVETGEAFLRTRGVVVPSSESDAHSTGSTQIA